jgi:hypothetical protein
MDYYTRHCIVQAETYTKDRPTYDATAKEYTAKVRQDRGRRNNIVWDKN